VLKLMYLAKRKPDFTHAQFAARWRKHGALAMSLPLWRHMSGYVQADVLHPTPVPGTSEDFDGVGILWAPSDDMWRNPQPTDVRDVQTLLEDEHHTFGHAGLARNAVAAASCSAIALPIPELLPLTNVHFPSS
jgi:hypothetical protein